MCLGVPGEIVELNSEEQWAVIECYGVRNKVYTPLMTEEFTTGDYLMIHAGYAIGKIDPEEAQKTLELLEQIANEDI
jgi:hydrogenase expression/formation protein HypC